MATRLPEPLLTDAMSRLPAWSGDPDAIHGHFDLDDEHRRQLVDALTGLADRTGHPIAVDQTSAGLEITLVTSEVQGVSEVDIALASRITDLASGAATRAMPRQRQAADLNREPTTFIAAAPKEPE